MKVDSETETGAGKLRVSTDLESMYRTPLSEGLPETFTISFGGRKLEYHKVSWEGPGNQQGIGLRYGENPHQPAAFYAAPGMAGLGGVQWLKMGKGGPSWINIGDMEHAMRILRYFDEPAVAVMKHLNPSGVAMRRGNQGLDAVFAAARDCDSRAAFGGVVGCNVTVDAATATEMGQGYIEAVLAPGYTSEALEILSAKKDLRVAKVGDPRGLPRFVGDDPAPMVDLKVLGDGSLLVQEPFLSKIRSVRDFKLNPRAGETVALLTPSDQELEDLRFAWYVNTGVRSNGIVLAKDGRTLAIGTGEQERIGAIEQAIAKAAQKGHSLEGAVMSSDAFIPFRDAVDACAAVGIKAIAQPGGSRRDAEVLAACNEYGIALVFTEERCFGHF